MASVMTFSKEEKETVINFDYEKGTWSIYTNVPSHMTIIKKKYLKYATVLTVNGNGAETSMRADGIKKMISFRSVKESEQDDYKYCVMALYCLYFSLCISVFLSSVYKRISTNENSQFCRYDVLRSYILAINDVDLI